MACRSSNAPNEDFQNKGKVKPIPWWTDEWWLGNGTSEEEPERAFQILGEAMRLRCDVLLEDLDGLCGFSFEDLD